MGLVAPGAHTPKAKSCGVASKARRPVALVPSWPVSATVNTQPEPTVPNAARGSTIVAVSLGGSAISWADPRDVLPAFTHCTGANPWASTRSLHASAGAIV